MDYAVDYAALARAGDKAAGLATDIAATLRDMRLDGIAAAVPGGLSAGAAEHVDGKWVSASGELVDALRRHAEALTSTADAYRLAEERAAAAADAFFGGL